MRWIRAGLRFKLLVLVTGFFYVLLMIGMAAVFWRPRWRVRWRQRIFRSWSRSLLAVLGVQVEESGAPPAAPFLLVSNHLSYLDVPVLASRLDAVFVAKQEVRSWPVMGRLCRAADTIFVDRGSRRDIPRVLGRIEGALGRGDGVVLFPEGTSSGGDDVGPFRPSLLEAAARGRLSISYAALGYRTADGDPPARTAVCWWGGMTFPGHIMGLLRLRRVDARLSFGRETIQDDDRKQLAQRLHGKVRDIFTPAGEVV